ncbi:MAG: hypothetical protein H6645_11265 [Caldilineaceae bacterium]|nr:hypothetical protein [Caldilineaceae bacterium]
MDPDRAMILVFINATTQPVTFTDETLAGLTLTGERALPMTPATALLPFRLSQRQCWPKGSRWFQGQ